MNEGRVLPSLVPTGTASTASTDSLFSPREHGVREIIARPASPGTTSASIAEGRRTSESARPERVIWGKRNLLSQRVAAQNIRGRSDCGTYARPMGAQIVVSGGAGYWSGPEGAKLDSFVLSLTGKTTPRICALCTASGDSERYIEGFYDNFRESCDVSHLPLFEPLFFQPETLLVAQDVIYVGGGNTANLLAIWRLHGVDRLLRTALDNGAILYGSSAGGLCWFESGVTDSLGFDGVLRPFWNGLGFLRGSHAPHFDSEGRRSAYSEMVEACKLPEGIGIDELAAVHFIDGQIHETVSAANGAASYRVVLDADGKASVTTLPSTAL